MAKVKLDTVAGRTKIPAGHLAWQRREAGKAIGFRPGKGQGQWWARIREPGGKLHYRRLGDFGDVLPGDRFDAAVKAAAEWFREADAGLDLAAGEVTVRQACERHVKAIRAKDGDGKADETEARFKRHVFDDAIASLSISQLRKRHLDAWRERLAAKPAAVWRRKTAEVKARNRPGVAAKASRPRSASTVNRDMVPLRAALNRAHADGLVASNVAWRAALAPTKGADRQRDVYLDRAQRRALLDAAPADLASFLRALSLLPLRPGALAVLTVADFDVRLSVLRIGTDKAGKDRRITLPETTAVFLAQQAKGKTPAAPLLSRSNGAAWDKDSWKDPVRDSVKAAGLAPNVTAYALRHSTITDLVAQGLPTLTVAQLSGTSVAMIEKHYGHLQQDQARDALARLAL
ncbi:MAG: tyrosine-type recombinase/integrase [Novosphingobium sp.]